MSSTPVELLRDEEDVLTQWLQEGIEKHIKDRTTQTAAFQQLIAHPQYAPINIRLALESACGLLKAAQDAAKGQRLRAKQCLDITKVDEYYAGANISLNPPQLNELDVWRDEAGLKESLEMEAELRENLKLVCVEIETWERATEQLMKDINGLEQVEEAK